MIYFHNLMFTKKKSKPYEQVRKKWTIEKTDLLW